MQYCTRIFLYNFSVVLAGSRPLQVPLPAKSLHRAPEALQGSLSDMDLNACGFCRIGVRMGVSVILVLEGPPPTHFGNLRNCRQK